jgi:hypothetical protein
MMIWSRMCGMVFRLEGAYRVGQPARADSHAPGVGISPELRPTTGLD